MENINPNHIINELNTANKEQIKIHTEADDKTYVISTEVESNLNTPKDNTKDTNSDGKFKKGNTVGKQFKKGHKLLSKRPIRSQHFSVLIEKHLDNLNTDEAATDTMTNKELMVKNLVDKAVNETDLKSINWLAERIEGKVADQVILNADVTMTPLEIVMAKSKKVEADTDEEE